jgi:energy-coupling factor transport system substrate-specific component
MNPLAMVLRSAVYSALLVILLTKVPKCGALLLTTVVGSLISFFLLGQAMISLPAALLGAALAELAALALGGIGQRRWLSALMVGISELTSRALNMGLAYLAIREQPALLIMIGTISVCGALGAVIGLAGGVRLAGELRRAGLIQN